MLLKNVFGPRRLTDFKNTSIECFFTTLVEKPHYRNDVKLQCLMLVVLSIQWLSEKFLLIRQILHIILSIHIP